MKTVWILNHYAGEMFFQNGGRHYYFSKYLKTKGYNPIVFCANSKHNSKSESFLNIRGLWKEKINETTDVPFVFIKTKAYQNNGLTRILNMIQFYKNVKKTAFEYGKKNGKPDIILASSVHPLTLLAGIRIARCFGVKCISEIRDLWPESIVEYSGKFRHDSLFIRILYAGERFIYKESDMLVFTMEGAYDYINERRWEKYIPKSKVICINNGVDLEQFDSNKVLYRIDDEEINNESIFKVVYVGSIRKVNDLNRILNIAKEIKNDKIRFLIWGDGDQLHLLKERVERERINNVVFKGYVDKKYIPYITSQADLNLAHNSNSRIFRFGVSLNKVFEYLAAGKPILCDFFSNYNPIIEYGAGLSVSSLGVKEIAKALDTIAEMDVTELNRYGVNARKAACEYDYKNLTEALVNVIEQIV